VIHRTHHLQSRAVCDAHAHVRDQGNAAPHRVEGGTLRGWCNRPAVADRAARPESSYRSARVSAQKQTIQTSEIMAKGKQSSSRSPKLSSPKVARKSCWARSTANSPLIFPKTTRDGWYKLSVADQLDALDEVQDTAKKLKAEIMQKSHDALFPNKEASPPRTEYQTARPSDDCPRTPPPRQHASKKKKKFKPSPSPEALRGDPHHPARDGTRSSFSLPAFSPTK
jgi:hypothetical protein